MERDLITKIKDLIDNETELEDANWFINLLDEYVCTFNYDNKKYIITIEEVVDNEIN
jgi:hypothetical protein